MRGGRGGWNSRINNTCRVVFNSASLLATLFPYLSHHTVTASIIHDDPLTPSCERSGEEKNCEKKGAERREGAS